MTAISTPLLLLRHVLLMGAPPLLSTVWSVSVDKGEVFNILGLGGIWTQGEVLPARHILDKDLIKDFRNKQPDQLSPYGRGLSTCRHPTAGPSTASVSEEDSSPEEDSILDEMTPPRSSTDPPSHPVVPALGCQELSPVTICSVASLLQREITVTVPSSQHTCCHTVINVPAVSTSSTVTLCQIKFTSMEAFSSPLFSLRSSLFTLYTITIYRGFITILAFNF